ncbi:MAG: DUF4399 domain-containing protein [Proteobacteria bacterium]|nr:DUF4399 domain-containing protein [Pseudomonadota bacterium]
MRTLLAACLALLLCGAAVGAEERTPSPPGAQTYIISPHDGARVHNPFKVQFGLSGMGVAPAGVRFENTGHHHLLIDTGVPADLGAPLPTSDSVRHFGKGQTETMLTLPPGRHTLQLIVGDQNHVPLDPPVISKKITVKVVR